MNKIILIVVILAIAVAGGYYFGFGNQDETMNTENTEDDQNVEATNTPTATPTTAGEESGDIKEEIKEVIGSVKEFTVVGTPFKFTPAEIRVKRGDKVKIIFKNDQGMHDFVIDELSVKTKVLQAGQSEVIEFTPNQAGTFEFYCSVGNHRQMGMVGKLIVE
jgi:plastocyanin